MTMLVYERQDDFIEKMEKLEKETPVYLTVVHAKQNNNHVAVIRIQFADVTGGYFHTYNFGEGINPVEILDMEVVSVMPTDELKKQMMDKYQADLDKFNKEVMESYDKIKKSIQTLGFKKVVNGYSM